MLDMVLNFVREQGVFVILGLMAAGGIFSQLMASRRFRKLRRGIQSLAALQTPVKQDMPFAAQRTRAERDGRRGERNREEPYGQGDSRERTPVYDNPGEQNEDSAELTAMAADGAPEAVPVDASEVDSQLLYLKQSLDRIAAGRDQKYDEDTPKHRKLTPAEEQIIVDILKEYLS